jgi:hypothetical protein
MPNKMDLLPEVIELDILMVMEELGMDPERILPHILNNKSEQDSKLCKYFEV